MMTENETVDVLSRRKCFQSRRT